MANLISCDDGLNRIYQHDGLSSSILNYFDAPGNTPWGLTYIGSDLWSCDDATSRVYHHVGVSASLYGYFTVPSGCNGLGFNGTNLTSISNNGDKIYRHSGVTSTITYTRSSPGANPTGCTFNGTNMYTCDTSIYTAKEIFRHSGDSTTIVLQFSTAANPTGLAFDGTNLWSCYDSVAKIGKHIADSSSYSLYFASPGSSPTGLTIQTGADVSPPTVTTGSASGVTEAQFNIFGNVLSTGGLTVTTRGFCYKAGTSGDPTTADSTNSDSGSFGTGAFNETISGLAEDTSYRIRAYAINASGTSYGSTITVKTDEDIPVPDAPTNVAATDGTHDDKVVVTWTGSAGATGYRVYQDGADVSGLLGIVETYDDVDADAAVITPGTAAATDGTSEAHVSLSLSGESVANGTTHTYTVKAVGAGGTSAASASNTGYRGHGTVTYLWQRSSTDADSGYSDIAGATLDAYDDTEVPISTVSGGSSVASDGTIAAHVSLSVSGEEAVSYGRYYRCTQSADGCVSVNSVANRGYRGVGSITYQWQRSAADSDASYSDIVAGTTDAYDDTAAPADGSGRYFQCVLSASGTTGATSTADRGYREADAPTDVAATSGVHTDKVVVTWTGVAGGTGYQVYRDDVALGWLGDVATYDDIGADAGVITPGTAVASDGTEAAKVVLGVSDESVANGTTHTYKVRARRGASETVDSTTDTGYRGVGAITYQWKRSAEDADSDFAEIVGATTENYDDTGAPA